MKNWKTLPREVYDQVWNKFYKDFSFKPSVFEKDWPSIKTDKPNMKFSIKNLWGVSYNGLINKDFIQRAIDAFVSVTDPGEEIFALDWQHEGFYINPRQLSPEIMTDESSNKVVSFKPNGDYYIFMTKDFENIWFGHPWEKTITIVGTAIVDAFNKNKPLFLLNEKKRIRRF